MESNRPLVFKNLYSGEEHQDSQTIAAIQEILDRLPLEVRLEGNDSKLAVWSDRENSGNLHAYPEGGKISDYKIFDYNGDVRGSPNKIYLSIEDVAGLTLHFHKKP